MSTRCQVLVKQKGLDWDQEVMLYHHCDGYPSGIVPLLQEALKGAPQNWQSGRAGKVAGMVCATDPGGFEPETGLSLHGDIEWLYVLTVVNGKRGSAAEDKPTWILEVYQPGEGFYHLRCPTQKDMKRVFQGNLEYAEAEKIGASDDGE